MKVNQKTYKMLIIEHLYSEALTDTLVQKYLFNSMNIENNNNNKNKNKNNLKHNSKILDIRN